MEALKHWSMFGQKGEPSPNRAVATNWKTKSFSKPVTALWDLTVSKADLPNILNGFVPRAMEDKWFVYSEGPDDEGIITTHFHRSWTGHKVAEVKLSTDIKQKGKGATDEAHFTEIVWESDSELIRQTEMDAKDTVVRVCQWCLNAESPLKAMAPKEE